jgi:hypothetical protein
LLAPSFCWMDLATIELLVSVVIVSLSSIIGQRGWKLFWSSVDLV